jgi:hypothetical protein
MNSRAGLAPTPSLRGTRLVVAFAVGAALLNAIFLYLGWEQYRGLWGIYVLSFASLTTAETLVFVFLVRQSLRRDLVYAGVLTALIAIAATAARLLSEFGAVTNGIILSVLAFAAGLFMGAPRRRLASQAGIGLASGFIASFWGLSLSVPLVLSIQPAGSSFVPVLFFSAAAVIAFFASLACALGSVIGTSLRRRRQGLPAIA